MSHPVHPAITALKAARERQGVSAHQAGPRAGLGRATVGQWERGRHRPGIEELEIYARSLGYTITLSATGRRP